MSTKPFFFFQLLREQ
ncbi:hypothetical protein CIB84_016728 [Bambusicola thoracicus]|uniref:Uncharacterized protein n=1 Tax=Bambusicola thoracicus TaxID=9083 RepID=A0A2P4S5W9_BAMTH|nr:hypothetical protein CIB84_016728 [Bambusicola thoracicus]